MKIPLQHETTIGEGESLLSIYEIQRILLGRTLLKKASIHIFDECTSRLDVNTE